MLGTEPGEKRREEVQDKMLDVAVQHRTPPPTQFPRRQRAPQQVRAPRRVVATRTCPTLAGASPPTPDLQLRLLQPNSSLHLEEQD